MRRPVTDELPRPITWSPSSTRVSPTVLLPLPDVSHASVTRLKLAVTRVVVTRVTPRVPILHHVRGGQAGCGADVLDDPGIHLPVEEEPHLVSRHEHVLGHPRSSS